MKSTRHKETNTFKFQPFADRIANINIDIFHRVGHEYETQLEENECLFYQTIEKWNVLNLTEYYSAFRKEIKANNIITLPQLLHNKEAVVQTLLKHLRYKNVLCLQPLLELVVALANDLRKEFYPYYPEFLSIIIELLNTKDTDQLEWAFTCLAYLFKFLWRPLTKDVNVVFSNLLPLLSDDKPYYINDFAAESFAFVVRKVKDRLNFLTLLLKSVKSSRDGITGCGKLLFRVIFGVNGQFHSCADTFLPFLLDSLANEKLPQNILFEIFEEIVSNIAKHVRPDKSDLFWLSCIDGLQKDSPFSVKELILKLIGEALEHRNGKLLQTPIPLVQIIVNLIALPDIPESTLLVITQVSVLILLSKNIRLPQEHASSLTRRMLTLPNKVLLYFIDHVTAYSSFEAFILPAFLKYCIEHDLEYDCLQVLSKLILKKAPLCNGGINLEQWSKYVLDFGSKQNNDRIYEILQNHIQFESENLLKNDFTNYVSGLICLPHLNVNHCNETVQLLSNNLNLLCKLIKEETAASNDTNLLRKLLFLLLVTLECSTHVMLPENLAPQLSTLLDAILDLTPDPKLSCSLRILDLYLSCMQKDAQVVSVEVLSAINKKLESNFSSPYHEVRLLTTHIYTLFESTCSKDTEKWDLFTLCHTIESISPQVDTYRNQIQNLERLACDKGQMSLCKGTEFNKIPLRFLCGTLYRNFKLLWDPVIAIIVTHAQGLELADFWEVFGRELKNVVENTKNPPEFKDDSLEETGCDFLQDLYKNVCQIDTRVDFNNYRLLLWKSLFLFPEIAEAKTRDVSELFLNFMEQEYMKSNSDVAMTWNIKENVVKEEHDEGKTEDTKRIAPKFNSSNNLRILQEHLSVFTKIRSPKSMYREPELYRIYFDLLAHKSPEIQKLALDSLLTYKFKYLTPYAEHLKNLINDKNFKDELVYFKVDKENATIQEEHRENLMAVVLKIVYSKMSAKTGLRTGGKSSGQLRRHLVLRFLAGCHGREMMIFAKMAFHVYNKHFEDDLQVMLEKISREIDLEKFIPPKRLQSSLNLLEIILEQFGGLMGDEMLSFLLRVLFTIGSFIKGANERIANVHAGYTTILRALRSSCLKILHKFFERFDKYPWTSMEINATFDVFVWPYLSKLPVEGIHSPTSLLKLLAQWGCNPRYFVLLVKHAPDDVTQHPLPYILKLLLNKQTHNSVQVLIMEMFEKMLSLISDEQQDLPLPVEGILPVSAEVLERLKITENLNYGSCILLPHISSILEVIKRKLETKSKFVSQKELFILSRISELVWDSDLSDQVLRLLLPVVLKKCNAGEETVLKFVSTISNLLRNVQEPSKHFKLLSPLFGEVPYVSCRKILCNILDDIATRCQNSQYSQLAALVAELNAWDAKWVDQPDFQRRLDGFRQTQKLIEEDGALDLTLGVIVIHNCSHIIRSENDLSLRENAAHCWKNVACALIKKHQHSSKELDYILNDLLFTIIRKGFKNKNEEARNECILLLGHLARECADAHPVLFDLHKLTDKVDVEVDFFENMTHLQVHRHARALLKFSQIFKKEMDPPNTRTLTQFVLPLATAYLCSEKFANKNSLIDSVIEVIGTVSRLLPWHQYEGVLKFYLGKLRQKIDYQRQLVRLIVAILDAYHFDLSKGFVDAKTQKEEAEAPVTNEPTKVEEEEEQEVDDALEAREETTAEALDAEEEEKNIKAFDRIKILSPSTATKVIRVIQIVLLPQLQKSLAEMTHHESSHKLNRKKTGFEREEEDLLRVPISLALVKLLQRLPKEILDANLPGIFLKSCSFLRSQLESVRRVARETLQKIMITLGPSYLGLLLKQMTTLLSRGYQVHVLVYTVHAILVHLKDKYREGDVDKILPMVLDLCRIDLFGSLADEKEVAKIGRKVSEAKSTKSFDTLQILAQFITETCLMDIILPIRTVLTTSHTFKIVFKAQEGLRHIALGLIENEYISLESLLKFAYGTSSESIPALLCGKEKPAKKEKSQSEKTDCFIIPAAPISKSGVRHSNVKSSENTNAHLLVEFGLRLCNHLLKKEKLNDEEFKPFVDPFVVVFKNCLTSRNVKLETLTLQCLGRMMKYDLPSLRELIADITELIFGILHKYAAAGLSKGDNFELVVAAFKTMSVIVRDVKFYVISTDQLKTLLLYAEQDLYNHDRQATAFALLRSIIARKLSCKEIHGIMQKVAEISITSDLPHVRQQARLVFYNYLMDYPLKAKLGNYVSFYLSQLKYEMQSGRESAIEMIQSLILAFPEETLKEYTAVILIGLGARLVNEDVAECRKVAADCLVSMFKRLKRPDVDPLFEMILLWLKDRNKTHRQMAAQLCGLLVNVEKAAFESRLPVLMPVIFKQFGFGDEVNKPGCHVLRKDPVEDEDKPKGRINDHHLFQVLQMLLKICAQCPSFLKSTEDIQLLAEYIQTLLGYPHAWVRLAAAQFLGFVLSSLDIEKLSRLLIAREAEDAGYLYNDPEASLKALTLDLCAQLQPGGITSELAEQVVKNLVFVARVLDKVPISSAKTEDNQKIDFLWLTKRMRRIVNMEVVQTPTETTLRTEVFKWIAGIVTVLDEEKIIAALYHLLAPLVREMVTTDVNNKSLRYLSKEVGKLLKNKIGMELYTSTLSKLQQHLAVKRSERKRERNQLAVTDPEMYAKKKIKLNEKKKVAKKRKIEKKGRVRKVKRRKMEEDVTSDII